MQINKEVIAEHTWKFRCAHSYKLYELDNIVDENIPFRWNLKHRAQLGSLLSGDVAPSYDGFVDDVRWCCAKILARARNSDIVFVGRSPESLYDYLMGVTEGTSYENRVLMLNLSMRYENVEEIISKGKIYRAMKRHFSALKLDPHNMVKRKQPVMYTDVVCDGYTFENIYLLVKHWAIEESCDFYAVKQKLRFLGLTWRVQSSRYIDRWWQNFVWTNEVSPRAIKNISIPGQFWDYLGNTQKKVENSYRPEDWGKCKASIPSHNTEHLEALRLAYQVYRLAKQRSEKKRLAREVVNNIEMKEAWLRRLILEIRKKGVHNREEKIN